MTPDEIINKWIGCDLPDDGQIVTDTTDRVIAGLKADIQQAINAAVEEDRRTRPHIFVGRRDRWCELCNEPDWDKRHIPSRETLWNSVKLAVEEEREACAKIADYAEEVWIAEQIRERGNTYATENKNT